MEFEELISKLEGSWKGEYKLWLDPTQEPRVSKTTGEVNWILKEKFVDFIYEWEDSGEPQIGRLSLKFDQKKKLIHSCWIDTWHQSTEFMTAPGYFEDKTISFKGSYITGVTEGPPWEWRTKIKLVSKNEFLFEMYNITPRGEEGLAVQVNYKRK